LIVIFVFVNLIKMEDRIRKNQFKYLDYLFESLYSVKSKFYTDSTFFKKNDKVILELEKSGTLWVLYSVWTDISNMFSYGYEETQQLIKEWAESQLNSRKVVPEGLLDGGFTQVEKQLNSEVVTPSVGKLYVSDFMEEQLKLEEITPNATLTSYHLKVVEEQLKQEEITPRQVVNGSFDWIHKQVILEEMIPTSFFVKKKI